MSTCAGVSRGVPTLPNLHLGGRAPRHRIAAAAVHVGPLRRPGRIRCVRLRLAADVIKGVSAVIIGKPGTQGWGIAIGHRTLAATDERGYQDGSCDEDMTLTANARYR